MKIPTRLNELLSDNKQLHGAVTLAIASFEPWIKHSTLPFFPEYTKHDIEHIEAVLATASSLIRDEAWKALTPADAGVLTLATLLHDAAMHISEDGFVSLLDFPRSTASTPDIKDRPWNIVWEEFLGEASRFDGRKLIQLFGDSTPIRRPPAQPVRMTKRDRLLIGEFLRRHHARLAQEIAWFGVPTKGESRLLLQGFSGSTEHIPGLSGLVARSHSAHIRMFFAALDEKYDRREFQGIHAVFLMAVLRVADFLQVNAERAPNQMLRVRQLSSPVSLGEWRAHQAIRDVRHTHDDPEAIYIDALPTDVRTYLRIDQWLRGIQKEMDDSWAVLGEVYGRIEALRPLGLELRRVRSSLDDPVSFARKVEYLPVEARFRAADADLLKLLIEPLYGERPEVGVRELIQNAVDAVLELREVLRLRPAGDISLTEQTADVIVTVEQAADEKHWIVVSDQGIGMTPEVVLDYFLTAGASFRRSEEWRRTFEDARGRSKVLRAGRFGVGALASFLLGPEIAVSTRHVDQDTGIAFSASVESDLLELRRLQRPVGTTIRIQISPHLAGQLEKEPRPDSYSPTRWYHRSEDLNWDWYCLANPHVQRYANGNLLTQRYTVPSPGSRRLAPPWHRIVHPNFADILWTFAEAPELTCNGIRAEEPFREHSHYWSDRFGLNMPNVTVFDRDGKLPLNLQRTGLTTGGYPFDYQLSRDVISDFLGFTLSRYPKSGPIGLDLCAWLSELSYPGSVRIARYRSDNDWFFTSDGIGFIDPQILAKSGCRSALVLRSSTSFSSLPFQPAPHQAIVAVQGDNGATAWDYWMRSVLEVGNCHEDRYMRHIPARTSIAMLGALPVIGLRVLLSEVAWRRAQKHVPKFLTRTATLETTFGDWHVIAVGKCDTSFADFPAFASASKDVFDSVTEIYWERSNQATATPVGSQWLEIFGEPVIAFDETLRNRRFSKAFAALKSYVEGWDGISSENLQAMLSGAE